MIEPSVREGHSLPFRRPSRRRVNALVYVTAKIGPEVLPYLLQNPDLNLRVVCDCSKYEFQNYLDFKKHLDDVAWVENTPQDAYRNESQMQGHKLAKWADLLVIVMDASMTSLMLAGFTTDVILHVLRCWDTSKRIVMLPEMSVDQWKHPLWRKQLSKLQRKLDWVHVLQPALWDFAEDPHGMTQPGANPLGFDTSPEIDWQWDGPEEILEAIHSEAQTILRRSRLKTISSKPRQDSGQDEDGLDKPRLPLEIWTNVLDFLGDWELATALGIYHHLPVPHEWQSLIPHPGSKKRTLEYTILTQPLNHIRSYFTTSASYQPPKTLSPIATKLIFRFSMTKLLTYLALQQKDIFWTSFGLALLPHKASLIYNSPSILQWWKDCPAVIKKEYGPEAMDGASRAGFVEVLDWWLDSNLPLCYTEKALESASAKGHVDVLEWWRVNSEKLVGSPREMPLKVGKSIMLAAQSGRTSSIEWWENSGIPYSHEDGVARLASQHGHVAVLELWHSFKGSKMIFDNQVLVGATKNGHAPILQWWKEASRKHGLKVEYKTCDIEEAMEDAVGGGGEGEVREWWGRNGLNLGVGTGEWMKVKTL
jgi:Flavoprotein